MSEGNEGGRYQIPAAHAARLLSLVDRHGKPNGSMSTWLVGGQPNACSAGMGARFYELGERVCAEFREQGAAETRNKRGRALARYLSGLLDRARPRRDR